MDGKDPFGYPVYYYLYVITIACCAGLIKYLNKMQSFSIGKALIETITSGFTGLMTFWICKWANIDGPLLAFMIAVSGLMGSRAWQEFEHFWRLKFGVADLSKISTKQEQIHINSDSSSPAVDAKEN